MMKGAFCVYLFLIWVVFFLDKAQLDRKNDLQKQLWEYRKKQEETRRYEAQRRREREETAYSVEEQPEDLKPQPKRSPELFYLVLSGMDNLLILWAMISGN